MTESTISRRLYLSGLASLLATAGCLGERSGGGSGSTELPEPQEAKPTDLQGAEAIDPEGTELDFPATAVSADALQVPVRGDPDADVTVSTYEDYACPHCRDYTMSVVPKLADEFIESEKIRYERRDFPIPVHETWSWAAADAARAVQDEQGLDAFWEYSDLLYENQDAYSFDLFPNLAEQVGGDGEAVREAVNEEVYRPVVESDRERGRERGVTGTPTVFVNGRSVNADFESISQAIENELDSSG